MTHEIGTRLAVALVVSAAIHATALSPVNAPSRPVVSTPFANALKARLQVGDAPPSGLTETSRQETSMPSAEYLAIAPPSLSHEPRASNPERAVPATPAVPHAAGEPNARTGVRAALPDEVKVFVHRYEAKAEENPNAVMDLKTGKYFYFNAPQLKQASSPLADATPQYPAVKLDQPHGAVMLLLFIDEQGKIEKTAVECAHPAFEESAVASIRDMQFVAARDANGPVKSYMKVEFRYGLGTPCGRPPPTPQQVINPAANAR